MKNLCKIITKSGKICKKYKEKNCNSCSTHKPKEKCVICFENIYRRKTLQCSHNFCLDCINKWIYIEQKETCPLCRNLISEDEEYDAFEYCLQNRLITKYQSYKYFIINEELQNFLDDIVVSHSDYDHIEWNTIINYIKTNERMYSLFLNSDHFIYISYHLFNEHRQGINNVVYEYTINFV
jgi:hypothetical protein